MFGKGYSNVPRRARNHYNKECRLCTYYGALGCTNKRVVKEDMVFTGEVEFCSLFTRRK